MTTHAESFQIQPLSIPTSQSSSSSGVSLHPLHCRSGYHQRRNDHVRFMSGTGAGTGGGNSEDDNLASLAFNTEGSTTSRNTNTNDNSSSTTSTASASSSIASSIKQALQEAKDLKECAAKERLEAEKMSI